MTVYLPVCLSAGLHNFKKNNEKTGLCPNSIPLYFESDPDHCLGTKIIKGIDFLIYLLLSCFFLRKKTYMSWHR